MLGRVGPDRLELTQVNRFRNGAVRLPDGLCWDVLGLYQDILDGLRDAHRKAPDPAGIGIDTWSRRLRAAGRPRRAGRQSSELPGILAPTR